MSSFLPFCLSDNWTLPAARAPRGRRGGEGRGHLFSLGWRRRRYTGRQQKKRRKVVPTTSPPPAISYLSKSSSFFPSQGRKEEEKGGPGRSKSSLGGKNFAGVRNPPLFFFLFPARYVSATRIPPLHFFMPVGFRAAVAAEAAKKGKETEKRRKKRSDFPPFCFVSSAIKGEGPGEKTKSNHSGGSEEQLFIISVSVIEGGRLLCCKMFVRVVPAQSLALPPSLSISRRRRRCCCKFYRKEKVGRRSRLLLSVVVHDLEKKKRQETAPGEGSRGKGDKVFDCLFPPQPLALQGGDGVLRPFRSWEQKLISPLGVGTKEEEERASWGT